MFNVQFFEVYAPTIRSPLRSKDLNVILYPHIHIALLAMSLVGSFFEINWKALNIKDSMRILIVLYVHPAFAVKSNTDTSEKKNK